MNCGGMLNVQITCFFGKAKNIVYDPAKSVDEESIEADLKDVCSQK
jgi:hypothetical protein